MNILIAPALGVFGLIVAFIVFSLVMRYSDGTDQVKKIGDEIHKGAMKFMKTEYTYLINFCSYISGIGSNLYLAGNQRLQLLLVPLVLLLLDLLECMQRPKQMLELQLLLNKMVLQQHYLFLFTAARSWDYVLPLLDLLV